MKSSTVESLVSIVEFALIAIAAVILAPYLVTAEHYRNTDRVHPSFPIAVTDHGRPGIIQWSTYKDSPEQYSAKLVTIPHDDVMTSAALAGNESFVIEKSGANYRLTYYADNYTFWSEYSIVNGVVRPTSFRFSGAFIVMPVLFIAWLGTAMLNWAVKRYLARRAGLG